MSCLAFTSIRPHSRPAPRQMRPPAAADRLLAGEQEPDPKVEEDQHFDVDDEGDEGVRQAPVHGELPLTKRQNELYRDFE